MPTTALLFTFQPLRNARLLWNFAKRIKITNLLFVALVAMLLSAQALIRQATACFLRCNLALLVNIQNLIQRLVVNRRLASPLIISLALRPKSLVVTVNP